MRLKSILESLVFASDRPITVKQLQSLTGNTKTESIAAALEDLEAEYRDSGIQLAQVGGGFQFRTHPDNAAWVKKLLAGRPPRLTRAMLETLAIVAYRQPITRPEIEDIRGVDSGGVIRILLERGLIRIMGKKEEVGRPILYGSTRQFLEFFNLKDLRELPTLKEFTELSEEHAGQVETQFGEEPEEAGVEAAGATAGTVAEPAEAAATQDASAVGPPPEEPALSAAPEEAAVAADQPADEGVVAAEETFPAAVATPDPADADQPPPEPPPGTFPAAINRPAPALAEMDEEAEDTALAALDRALDRVNGVLKVHRNMYPPPPRPAPAREAEGNTGQPGEPVPAASAEPSTEPSAAPDSVTEEAQPNSPAPEVVDEVALAQPDSPAIEEVDEEALAQPDSPVPEAVDEAIETQPDSPVPDVVDEVIETPPGPLPPATDESRNAGGDHG